MVVKTVDNIELYELCRRLTYKVYESSYHPDCVLAILDGGLKPAEIIRNELCKLYDDETIELAYVVIKQKNRRSVMSQFLKHLPVCLLNCMRVISLKIKRVVPSVKSGHIRVEIPDRCKKILIVDDAVDTGKTLSSVLNLISDCINVKTAVLTVTMSNSDLHPDYCIYDNEMILRFPWARDAK